MNHAQKKKTKVRFLAYERFVRLYENELLKYMKFHNVDCNSDTNVLFGKTMYLCIPFAYTTTLKTARFCKNVRHLGNATTYINTH